MRSIFRKKESQPGQLRFDPAQKQPVIRCSICTGEQVGGLKDLHTGTFEEIMVIRSAEDLGRFQKMVGTEEISKVY